MSLQIIDTKQFFISSNPDPNCGVCLNTDTAFKSNFRFVIPDFIRYDQNTQYITIKLIHAELPYSFYVVNSNNNLLAMTITTIGDVNVTITNGNYNATSLITYLNTYFQTNYPAIAMTFTLNTSTGRISMSANQSFSILSSSTCVRVLGLSGVTLNSTSNSLILPNPSDTSGPRTVLIKFNDFQSNSYNVTNRDILTFKSIPVVVPPFGLIYYQNVDNTETIVKTTSDRNNIEIILTDENNNILNFNGLDWTMAFEVKNYKRYNPTFNYSNSLETFNPHGNNINE
ncbi:MAG: hypothetical protein EOO43_01530 [Flavobacterium sp.]|nr:MAG: hypothetical protein EOO43_01530 [Flavobacterium sp.]